MILLNVGVKKLKKFKVFRAKEREPWGIVKDVCVSNYSDCVKALLVETISLVPLGKIVEISDIKRIERGRIILNEEYTSKKISDFNDFRYEFLNPTEVRAVKIRENENRRFKDMRFNLETGEITDIVVSKNIFSPKTKIPINKISVKENTIYIGRDEEKNSSKNPKTANEE